MNLESLELWAVGLRGFKPVPGGADLHTVLENRVWAHIEAERKKRGLAPGRGAQAALKAEVERLQAQAAALKAQALELMERAAALLAKAEALVARADR